jgi:hypothetical protein
LEFTFGLSTDAELEPGRGPGQIILHGAGRPLRWGMLDSLAEYPHWFVVACATLAAGALLWLLMKLLKAALWIMIVGILLVGGAAAIWLFFK